jgi:hypothetical protein
MSVILVLGKAHRPDERKGERKGRMAIVASDRSCDV